MGFLSFLFGSRPNSKPNPSVVQASEIQLEADFVVQLSDSEVRCLRPDGQVECITWNDLQWQRCPARHLASKFLHVTAGSPRLARALRPPK